MSGSQRVLHVGGTALDAQLVRVALANSDHDNGYALERASSLADAFRHLDRDPPSALLLDLELPDCDGMEALERLISAAPALPILVVGRDERAARQVAYAGAHEYLLIQHLDSYWLPRALRQAIDRRLSEAALLAEADRLEATLESVGETILSTDPAAPPAPPLAPTADAARRDLHPARAASVRLAYLASHDPLTDLPNRLLLGDRLARALSLAHRHGRLLAVLFLDVDRFKTINDSLGHLLGDELLRRIGSAVTACVRSSDTVSRQGGDEFVVVLTELGQQEDAAKGAQKIMAALRAPLHLAGHELHITVSIGIAVYPEDGDVPETLLQRADLALYDAKDQGRDGYRFFRSELTDRARERQSIEVGLHAALTQSQFELHYQPKLNLATERIIGAEALIRWRHPERGLLAPSAFVPVAEYCGLIKPIGLWVLREACRQARAWHDAGFPRVPISINVSAVEFRATGLLDNVLKALSDTGLEPHFLELEVTESALMGDLAKTNSALDSLKDLGVRLSIDDFGTGWSSLNYLRRFPIDALKIDRSFVQEITPLSIEAPLVTGMITMAKSLNYRVVAEGVETEEQLAFLRRQDCDEAQGFYFSRPVAAAQFSDLLRRANHEVWGGPPGRRLARRPTARGVVALFDASDDTVDMMTRLLKEAHTGQMLVCCHFSDLKSGIVDVVKYLEKHNPEVVIIDLSPPYHANWTFFTTLRHADAMQGRGIVLTTTNKARLDEMLGEDSQAVEVVGRPHDLALIEAAIQIQSHHAELGR